MGTQLLESVLTNGIRTTHFFNGRVLTAEDLRAEQEAERDHLRQLARAMGEGVVHGLEVTAGDAVQGIPVLEIQPGLGFNREGDAVDLDRAVSLRLVSEEAAVAPEAGLFAVCRAPDRTIQLTNVGLYVLTIRPASTLSAERAPMAELDGDGVAGGCGSRWAVEGVRFSVAPLPLAPAGESPSALASTLAALTLDVESDVDLVRRGGAGVTAAVLERLARRLSRLRNGTAHLCFGTDVAADRLASPPPSAARTTAAGYGAVDGMRARGELVSCELPLAVFYLSKRGVEWVDAWSVRRPLVPALVAGSLPALPDARRAAEALATVLQFQAQLAELMTSDLGTVALANVEAADRFLFLPPAGFLPLREGGTGRGFDDEAFFGDLALGGPTSVRASRLPSIVAGALLHAPVSLETGGSVQLWRAATELDGHGTSHQLVFVTRATAGPVWRDGLAIVLDTAWRAWRGVIRRRLFLPPGTDADKVAAQVSIVNAVRDVMDVATRSAALAAAGTLDDDAALAALRDLYDVQDDVQSLFRSTIPGIVHPQGRDVFGDGLNQRLDVGAPGGGTALLPALDAADLPAAVRAQAGINTFVAGWSGEGVAVGPLVIGYQTSPRGSEVVPGDAEGFPQIFHVRNGSDGTLAVTLEGSATAATGDWSEAVRMEDAAGNPLGDLRLSSGAGLDVTARVTAPPDAAIGEAVVLTVRGTVPPPNDRDVSATHGLTVAGTPGAPTVGTVEVVPPDTLPFTLDDAPPEAVGPFRFHLRFAGDDSLPASATFEVEVTLDSPEPALWPGQFASHSTEDDGAGHFTTTLTLDRDQLTLLEFLVRTPARGSGDRCATLRLDARSTDLDTAVAGALDSPFEICVRTT